MRSKLASTLSALKGVPLEKVTPSRRWKVHTVESSLCSPLGGQGGGGLAALVLGDQGLPHAQGHGGVVGVLLAGALVAGGGKDDLAGLVHGGRVSLPAGAEVWASGAGAPPQPDRDRAQATASSRDRVRFFMFMLLSN